jgi:hypothetical protein
VLGKLAENSDPLAHLAFAGESPEGFDAVVAPTRPAPELMNNNFSRSALININLIFILTIFAQHLGVPGF